MDMSEESQCGSGRLGQVTTRLRKGDCGLESFRPGNSVALVKPHPSRNSIRCGQNRSIRCVFRFNSRYEFDGALVLACLAQRLCVREC